MIRKIRFKTGFPFYGKERDGIKPNTFRKIDLNDYRFMQLIVWAYNGFKTPEEAEITIVNAEAPEYSFTRKIQDISIYDGYLIISWEHRHRIADSIPTKFPLEKEDVV